MTSSSSSFLLGLAGVFIALARPAVAQVSAVSCSVPTYNWTINSYNQDACLQAAYAVAACNNGLANITGLIDPAGGSVYTGPSGADNGDLCKCNSVGYSLISACAGCQGGSWLPYSAFVANCTISPEMGQWPASIDIPYGTAFPDWAYQNLTNNFWSNTSSYEYHLQDPGEQKRPTSGSPTSSSAPGSTASSGPSKGGGSNTGAIAGGVVGGVVGAALLAGLAFWLWRSRRSVSRASRAPSSVYLASTPQPHEPSFRSSIPISPRKYYDPSDPSTYPDAASASYTGPNPSSPGPGSISTRHQAMTSIGSRSDFAATDASHFRGLPEV